MGVFGGITSIGVIEDMKNSKDIKKKLDEIYNEIKYYDKEKNSIKEKIKNSESQIEILNTEMAKNQNVSKLELMKKQMDLMIAEETLKLKQAELEKNNSEKLEQLIGKITEDISQIERNIYIAVRFNNIGYIKYFNELKTSGKNQFDLEILKERRIELQDPEFIFFDELKQVRDYYEKATNVITDEEKLNMFESLIDEMIAEVIKEDMKKENVILPDFINGMRYFKHENEE